MEGNENRVTCILSDEEWAMLELWRQLTTSQQEAILEFIWAFI